MADNKDSEFKEETKDNNAVQSSKIPKDIKAKMKGRKNMFAEMQKFNKKNLNKTTTIVRHNIIIGKENNTGAGPDSALNDDEIKEFYDTPNDMKMKAIMLAKLLKTCKYTVIYTGAGVSTSAKLPDYRGPNGVWTLRAKGYEPQFSISCEQAIPTYTHMALVELLKHKMIKHVVSTNVDGLHRRSGLNGLELSELHGNIYREYCEICKSEYLRSFDVTKKRYKRYTGRLCQKNDCNGKLRDSIINFGENLPENELNKAIKHSENADLVIVLGSR